MTWDEAAEQREDRKWEVYEWEGKWEEESLGEKKIKEEKVSKKGSLGRRKSGKRSEEEKLYYIAKSLQCAQL